MKTPHGHHRRILLFVVALIVPALGLVALSLRMIRQERELSETRAAEERRRSTVQTRQALLSYVERIKVRAATALRARSGTDNHAEYDQIGVALVGGVDSGRLILPWETNRAAKEFSRLLQEGEFARSMHQGERAEFVDHALDSAATAYRQAMRDARVAAQAGYAQLSLARVHANAGRREEANANDASVFALGAGVVDEHGIPLALYAGGPLIAGGLEDRLVLDRLRAVMDWARGLPPPALYRVRDLARQLTTATSDAAVRAGAEQIASTSLSQAHRAEQALALQADFPRLPLRLADAVGDSAPDADPVWILYGDEPWLVSLAPSGPAMPAALVAVAARDVMAAIAADSAPTGTLPSTVVIASPGSSSGELLGPAFPGLRAEFLGAENGGTGTRWVLQQWFYLVVLVLVLTVTLLGAYLLWRDVRRELQVAELRSQFVSSVSHELKTPLTSIRMFAETMLMGRTADPKAQADYLHTIVSESERLTRLLNNVLEFSRIEQGTMAYQFGPTSLSDVVSAAVRALEYPLAREGFQFHVDAPDGLPMVNADRDALQQAILNLLSNAMKYSGDQRVIDLRVREHNGQAVIQVADHGIGIAAEEHGRIFEKFYRVPTASSKLIAGTGLGLTLVAHVAKAHGGHVDVRSALGEGSTFSIHLPLPT
jgi:signal transduction histidine kinase